VVKATNRELSYFLFFAINFCFITPIFYVTKPQDWSCKASNVSFRRNFQPQNCLSGVTFALCKWKSIWKFKVLLNEITRTSPRLWSPYLPTDNKSETFTFLKKNCRV